MTARKEPKEIIALFFSFVYASRRNKKSAAEAKLISPTNSRAQMTVYLKFVR